MLRNILITGGFGYVGGRLSTYLKKISPSINVRILTRRTTQIPAWADQFQWISGDLCSSKDMERACQDVDAIVHLAAANEIDSGRDPLMAMDVAARGTYHLLEAAATSGVKLFIYMSTFRVYGDCQEQVITENTVPRPIHPYGIVHVMAEDWLRMFHHQGRLSGIILRMSNSFGPPVDPYVNRWTLVCNDLCLQAVRTKQMILKTDGSQRRDFITLTDVCRAIHFFLQERTLELKGDLVFNLGGAMNISIAEMAQRIARLCLPVLGYHVELVYGPPAKEPHGMFQFNVEKLRDLGFQLTGEVDNELRDTLLFCHDHAEALKK